MSQGGRWTVAGHRQVVGCDVHHVKASPNVRAATCRQLVVSRSLEHTFSTTYRQSVLFTCIIGDNCRYIKAANCWTPTLRKAGRGFSLVYIIHIIRSKQMFA